MTTFCEIEFRLTYDKNTGEITKVGSCPLAMYGWPNNALVYEGDYAQRAHEGPHGGWKGVRRC